MRTPLRAIGCARVTMGNCAAARHLKHVKIAVAVPRIERLHRYRDQEIALSGVANALALRRMADAIGIDAAGETHGR